MMNTVLYTKRAKKTRLFCGLNFARVWRMKKILFFLMSFLLSLYPARAALPEGFQKTLISSNLTAPTALEIAPDGRIFVLELAGTVKIYKNGHMVATPFVTLPVNSVGERGLLGIAFDPDFSSNHFVYFYYVGTDLKIYVVRFNAAGDVATDGPVIIYQTTENSNTAHQAGTLRFGPDNKLYISIGDNTDAANAQKLTNPYGKILRINTDGTIPPDNPFINQAGALKEIWAYGLRNPFRFQFDPLTGKLYEGDVGEATWEEINIIEKGKNYGWSLAEGISGNPAFSNPLFVYNHNGGSASITGGSLYRGNMFPGEYGGSLFFGDYVLGFLKRLIFSPDGTPTSSDFDMQAGSIVDMKTATDGSLYYVTYYPGALYRITYSTGNQIPTAYASADTTSGIEPLAVSFSSMGSSDQEGAPLTYQWDFGDGTSSTSTNPRKIYSNKGTFSVQLTVSDGTNSARAFPLTIQVGAPPKIVIDIPADNSKYQAGETITYNAHGRDAQGFDLYDYNFTTEVLFHHATHIHPFVGPKTGKSGQFLIPITGESSADTFYEIKVTGRDTDNISATKSIFIYPETAVISLTTSPAGLSLYLGSLPVPATSVTRVVGFSETIGSDLIQEKNGIRYQFERWSDNGALSHPVRIPAGATTYTAFFKEVPPFSGEYFNNPSLTGTPTFSRQDPDINFDWQNNSPAPGIPADNFSVRWKKTQYFSAGTYRFSALTDDGVRLFINGAPIIDKWNGQVATEYAADITLSEGDHQIVMEYFDGGGGALAKLRWVYVGSYAVPPPPPPGGQGLKGEYFDTINLFGAAVTRVDPAIDFNWSNASPDATIGPDTFSVRWTGEIVPTFSEEYTFFTVADDGVRLWVNNTLVVDNWNDQPPSEKNGKVFLEAGRRYPIRFEYYENGGGAVAKLLWESVSESKKIIPAGKLFPTSSYIPGLSGEYFDNADLTHFVLKRVDPTIDFNWSSTSPDARIGPDTFSARWTGAITPNYSETYTFSVVSDDGVRLWINNQLIIDRWVNQPAQEWMGTIALEKGSKNSVRLEYFENGGEAVSKLLWSSPSQSKQIIPSSNLSSAF
jgi:glucose/arabinose dehydrogenase